MIGCWKGYGLGVEIGFQIGLSFVKRGATILGSVQGRGLGCSTGVRGV